MRSQDLYNNLNILKFDTISKLNIFQKKKKFNLFNIKKLKILVMLDSSDKFFYKKFLVLSNIVSSWFNQKVNIFKIINKKNNKKNIIYYQIGCTVNKLKEISIIVNYINCIMKGIALRIDNKLKLNHHKKYCIYNFNNLNYLLGFNNSKYFNIKMDYNIILIYNVNIKIINNKKLKNFYEKIFFL